jgi:hypothetical protein
MKKIFSLIPLVFLGCASSLTVTNPKYKSADFSSNCIALWPLNSKDIAMTNEDDVVDDFGKTDKRMPCDVIRDSCFFVMQNEIFKTKKKSMNVYKIDNNEPFISLSSDAYFNATYRVGKDSLPIAFSIPKKDSIKIKADLVLIINKMIFTRDKGGSSGVGVMVGGGVGGGMMMGGGGSFPELDVKFNYIIWNYADSQPVCYGQKSTESAFIFAMTHATWTGCFENIIHKAFENTPFELKVPGR